MVPVEALQPGLAMELEPGGPSIPIKFSHPFLELVRRRLEVKDHSTPVPPNIQIRLCALRVVGFITKCYALSLCLTRAQNREKCQ